MVSLSRAIDRFVGFFSPQTELRRIAARELIERQYAAAKGTTNSGSWNPVDNTVNTVIKDSIEKLRARARQLVRDMPAMATAVQRVEEFCVGDGISMQARVKDPDTGELAKGINEKIEDSWKQWCEKSDAGGRLHFYEMQQLACRQEIEVGEYIYLKRYSRGKNRYLPVLNTIHALVGPWRIILKMPTDGKSPNDTPLTK